MIKVPVMSKKSFHCFCFRIMSQTESVWAVGMQRVAEWLWPPLPGVMGGPRLGCGWMSMVWGLMRRCLLCLVFFVFFLLQIIGKAIWQSTTFKYFWANSSVQEFTRMIVWKKVLTRSFCLYVLYFQYTKSCRCRYMIHYIYTKDTLHLIKISYIPTPGILCLCWRIWHGRRAASPPPPPLVAGHCSLDNVVVGVAVGAAVCSRGHHARSKPC